MEIGMEITEVRIKLMENPEDRLRGFCSVTFDHCFVVRDLKIIEGNNGPFVAMPSRKLTSNCFKCGSKNHLRANYCNQCGNRQRQGKIEQDGDGRAKLYADIAHPVNAQCREMIQNRVIEELKAEQKLAEQPGYFSRYDDDYNEQSPSQKSVKPSDQSPSNANKNDSPTPNRIDSAESGPKPHSSKSNQSSKPTKSENTSDRGKPHAEQFGQGIFD